MQIRLSVAVAVLLTTVAHAAPAPEKLAAKLPTTQLKLFAVSYRSDKGTVGEVRFNDLPVIQLAGEGSSGSNSEVQGWLIPGTNRIDVVLGKVAGDAPVSFTLHGLAEPGFPDEGNAIVAVTIKKGTAPGTYAYSFELPEKQAPPAQLWKKAVVMSSVSDADKKALKDLAASFLAATKKGDLPALKKLFAFTLEERARITYSDPKEMVAMIDQMAPEMKKAFATATMATTLEYTLVGGGRVVKLSGAGGKPVIASRDGSTSMPIKAAKIDGAWVLVP
jgi:hypothetical protein